MRKKVARPGKTGVGSFGYDAAMIQPDNRIP
jgi:hypothetical protein